MLFFISNAFIENYRFLNIFHYITVRAMIAFVSSFIFSLFVFPHFIKLIKKISHKGQPIRTDGPAHEHKVGTPTMGGLIIIIAILLSSILTANLTNKYVLALLFVLISFGTLGFIDDWLKITKYNTKGVPGKVKLLFQCLISLLVILWINYEANQWFRSTLVFPIFKNFILNMGFFYTLFRIIVITGSSNAINLTDGLDGLVTMPIILSTTCLAIFAYIIGSTSYSGYLYFTYIKGVAEIVVPCAALIGGCFGFLWFNIKPAQIFMGDVGSLSLGAFLGTVAIIIKCEILFAIVGGLFVIEALSVILQVYYFRLTGGKRLFKMAPIHHHFEKCGWSEMQIVVRFWIIALLFTIAGLMMLKIR